MWALPLAMSLQLVASAPPVRTMLVVVDTGTIPAPLRDQLRKGLEGEVNLSAHWRLRERPDLSVDEIVLSLGCARLDQVCMGKMTGALRADAMLLATVASRHANKLDLWWVETRGKQVRATIAVSGVFDRGPDLVDSVRQTVRSRLGPVRSPRLRVLTSPVGAMVTVDGKEVGPSPATLELLPGEHRVEAALLGYLPRSQVLNVGATQELELSLALTMRPPAVIAPAVVDDKPAAAASPTDRSSSPLSSAPSREETPKPSVAAAGSTGESPAAPETPAEGGEAPARSKGNAWLGPVAYAVGGFGALGGGAALLGVLGALLLWGMSFVSWVLIWTVQVSRPLSVVVYPSSVAGGAVLVLAMLIGVVSGATVALAIVLKLVA